VADAVREYEDRATRYWTLDRREVRQEAARSLPAGDVVSREWTRVVAAAPGGADLVVCDERGRGFTSDEFAGWLSSRADRGRDVAFVIGGAFGLPDQARASAALCLALAPWTLPHDVARLVLAEQLYRAGTIVRGEPYHK
jgi:23S rRNA (pseudouridine1915-N3)-methyltransferase